MAVRYIMIVYINTIEVFCFSFILKSHFDVFFLFQVTVCDFPMYELLDQHKIMKPGILDAYPKLSEFVARFEALPAIKKYMSSDKFMKRPLNNKSAAFK